MTINTSLMSEKEKMLLSYLSRATEAEALLKSEGLHYAGTTLIWQILQIEFECTETPADILFMDLSVNMIIETFLKNIDLYGAPLFEIVLEESVLPDEANHSLIKARVKLNGEVWVVHKNDKDSFPSNPHAHNYDTNTKLHLGTGKLYRGKQVCGQVKRKELIEIRLLIQKRMTSLSLPDLVGV